MIKAILKSKTNTAQDTVLLGLERENITRLTKGEPIKIDGKELGLPFDIGIFFGETRKELMRIISPGVSEETKIQIGRGHGEVGKDL